MTGPITRSRSSAPSSARWRRPCPRRGTRIGSTALKIGAYSALPMPMSERHARPARPSTAGRRRSRRAASTTEKSACSTVRMISSFLRSKVSASMPPTIENRSSGPSWANMISADEDAGLSVRLVGERAEDDVLHPGADVRRERAEVDGAEVRWENAARAVPGVNGAVALEQGVLGVLARAGRRSPAGRSLPRHHRPERTDGAVRSSGNRRSYGGQRPRVDVMDNAPKVAVAPEWCRGLARRRGAGRRWRGGRRSPTPRRLVWTHPEGRRQTSALSRRAPRGSSGSSSPWAGIEPFTAIFDRDHRWTCAKGVYADPVAEHALALLLAGCATSPATPAPTPGGAQVGRQPLRRPGRDRRRRRHHRVAAARCSAPFGLRRHRRAPQPAPMDGAAAGGRRPNSSTTALPGADARRARPVALTPDDRRHHRRRQLELHGAPMRGW